MHFEVVLVCQSKTPESLVDDAYRILQSRYERRADRISILFLWQERSTVPEMEVCQGYGTSISSYFRSQKKLFGRSKSQAASTHQDLAQIQDLEIQDLNIVFISCVTGLREHFFSYARNAL